MYPLKTLNTRNTQAETQLCPDLFEAISDPELLGLHAGQHKPTIYRLGDQHDTVATSSQTSPV